MKLKSKDYSRGYENGRKVYYKGKGRYFNERYIPKDIVEKLEYIDGWLNGWDDAQKEDITVNT